MTVFDIEKDSVIKGIVANGNMSYNEALEHLIPLINKTEFQRRLQDRRFYEKLERDINDGCVMPPITVAFVINEQDLPNNDIETIKNYINKHITEAFVLDGIQRLNTLNRLRESPDLDRNKKLYINFIFCDSSDKLLYRMITLNNGQRPMTPRHQVEAMAANLNIFDKYQIKYKTEKEHIPYKTTPAAFNKSDLIQAYLAFMADSPLIDNKKIIQEKMDELIVGKIIASAPASDTTQFDIVLQTIAKFQKDEDAFKWLNITNNLIGFAVGLKTSGNFVLQMTPNEFVSLTSLFEQAFARFNPSKIKLGKYRRELSCEFFRRIQKFHDKTVEDIFEYLVSLTDE